ncbi:hypothetical protein BOTBODRAFT_33456 [Botryobasidium botryosum FD-172 SS1]|uniref:Uncharacterized protein n=1 Tax=Botryobasidium botryosum (strain FD-172 SS1) TaxID=930990 RepID=A0A067MD17_BOTB1|nr:hypothetical protein BOTBODRAFT_33456 [Botryobasidium botryosum FD-172 SS1]
MEFVAGTIVPRLQTLTDHIRSLTRTRKAGCTGEVDLLDLAYDSIQKTTSAMLAQLRTRRNQLALVHRLPNELLSLIFVLAEHSAGASASAVSPGPRKRGKTLTDNPCLCISAVCRTWRETALSTPRLWTNIDVSSVLLAEMFAVRSGSAPLDILVDLTEDNLIGPWAQVNTHMEQVAYWSKTVDRWATLKITGTEPIERDDVLPWMYLPAPSLEVLHISWGGRDVIGFPIASVNPFGGEAPRLRDVSLTAFHLPLHFPVFSGLTKLRLSRICLEEKEKMNPVLLLRVFEVSEGLEEIHISDMLTDAPDFDDKLYLSAPRDIDLSRLKSLFLIMLDASVIQFILTRIITPPASALELEVQGLRPGQDLSDIFPPHPTNLRNLQSVTYLLFGSTHRRDKCVVQGYATIAPVFTVVIRGSEGNGPVQRIMSSLGPTLALMPVTRFALYSYTCPRWSATTLFRTLGYFPHISVLCLQNCHAKFVRKLAVSGAHQPCPALDFLAISNCAIPNDVLIPVIRSRTSYNADMPAQMSRLKQVHLFGPLHGSVELKAALAEYVDVTWCPEEIAALAASVVGTTSTPAQ